MKYKKKKKLTLFQAAKPYAELAHAGQRFKYCIGPYIFHPLAVSERCWTEEEKAVGILHDAIEDTVAKQLKAIPKPQETFLRKTIRYIRETAAELFAEKRNPYEEALIKAELEKVNAYFLKYGLNVPQIIEDLDVLSKRSTDKGEKGYEAYIERIIAYAKRTGRISVIIVKMADLDDNSRLDRNPPLVSRTEKDIRRLARYQWARVRLMEAFPEVEPRPRQEDRQRAWKESKRPTDRRRGLNERLNWALEES